VKGAQSSLASRARRSEGGTEASCGWTLPEQLHCSPEGCTAAIVDVFQEAPITTRTLHCIIQSTVSGLLTRPSSTWTRSQFGKCASGGGTQDYEVRPPEMERYLMAFKAQLANVSKMNDTHQKK
jgi:hypothetical protein